MKLVASVPMQAREPERGTANHHLESNQVKSYVNLLKRTILDGGKIYVIKYIILVEKSHQRGVHLFAGHADFENGKCVVDVKVERLFPDGTLCLHCCPSKRLLNTLDISN